MQNNNQTLIGDLLRKAGLVTLHDLTNALQVATKSGLPIGRVLVMLGLVRPETVQATLLAQSLIRDRLLSQEKAIQAILIVQNQRVDLQEALGKLGYMQDDGGQKNRLGSFLIQTGLITAKQCEDALNASQHLGLPLGRVLSFKNVVPSSIIQTALDLQVMIRDGSITREEGMTALKQLYESKKPVYESLLELQCGVPKRRNIVRIGELLVMAQMVAEADLLTALEIGLVENKRIGDVLIELGYINELTLETALRLQEMVSNHHLTPTQAADVLRLYCEEGVGLAQALASITSPQVDSNEFPGVVELLRVSGLLPEDKALAVVEAEVTSTESFHKCISDLVGEPTLNVAVRCQLLISEGFLTSEQAIIALHYWKWSGEDLSGIIEKLGWISQNGAVIFSLPSQSHLGVG